MSERKKIVFIGAGGHFKSVLTVVKQLNEYSIVGVLDTAFVQGDLVEGVEVLGGDELIPDLINENCLFLITIGQVRQTEIRCNTYNKLKGLSASLATVVSPNAILADNVKLGEGTVVLNNVFINSGAEIGINCIINNMALLEHDVKIGNHSHVSTCACINGEVIIGNRVMIGSNSTIIQRLIIGDDCTIGAGSVVIKSTEAGKMIVGNPGVEK